MNILSLFDGISCGRLALERAGIKVDKYFASEIDKYAIQIAKKNYPDTIHIGSVTDVSYIGTPQGGVLQTGMYSSYETDIDMIIGGSPCQDLSIAKKGGQGLQGEKSSLFFEYVRLLKEVKPKYFLLENVASMKKADKEEITRILTEIYPDTQCYLINSALVSAQQRRRYYWSNIQGVEQPEDKGILLKDILEEKVDTKYMIKSDGFIAPNGKRIIPSGHEIQVFKEGRTEEGKLSRKIIRASTGRDSTLRSKDHKAYFGREGIKANCITTGLGAEQMIRVGQFNSGGQGDRVYSTEGKSVSLSANGGGRGAKTGLYEVPPVIRKLTPECFDLQAIKNILQLYLMTTLYATDNETNANSILLLLSESFNPQEVSKLKIGGIISFYETKILQSDMYGDGIGCKGINIQGLVNDPLPCTKTNGDRNYMGDMWERQCERCSSYGWRPHKQSENEFTETMQKLPQFTTQKIKAMQNMWEKAEMTRILREALPEIQEILRPKYDSMVTTPIIRKLTCVEAERLQTLPDNWTEGISNTQRYKAIGNGWTVDIIAHIFSFIK